MSNFDDTREFLAGVQAEGVSKLELLRFVERSRVREWMWTANADEEFITKRTQEIVRSAERDGLCRNTKEVPYLLLAFRLEAMGGHEFAEHPIRVPGAAATALAKGGAIEEDMPTSLLGLVQLLLRRDENMHKLILTQSEGNRHGLERQVAQLQQRVDADDGRRIQVYKLIEDLSSSQAHRDAIKAEGDREERRDKYLMKEASTYVPIVLNRFLGGGPGTGKLPMGEHILKQFLSNLGDRLASAGTNGGMLKLQPEEMLLLAEVYTSVAEAEKAKEAAEAAASGEPHPLNGTSNGASNGAAPAAGEGKAP